MTKKLWLIITGLLIASMILTACQPAAKPQATQSAEAPKGEMVRLSLAIQGEDRNPSEHRRQRRLAALGRFRDQNQNRLCQR
jgi:hypothetical protein